MCCGAWTTFELTVEIMLFFEWKNLWGMSEEKTLLKRLRDCKKKYKIIFTTATFVFVILPFFTHTFLGFSLYRSVGLRFLDPYLTKSFCFVRNRKLVWGYDQKPLCLVEYPDAAKHCSSSRECLSGLCVKRDYDQEAYCRKYSEDYPLCVNGEAKVENVPETEDYVFPVFLFCE